MQSKQQMAAFVTGFLETNLSPFYYYHSCDHSLYVVDKVIEIGQHEHCTAAEIELLKTAAFWHDTGYVKTYVNHEEAGCVLARQHLPEYGFSTEDIDKICGMIMATKMPQSPKNKLEEIIADADLEYLGTTDAAIKAGLFFKELHHLNPSLTKADWTKTQISFLQKHQYFTRYCKENKEPVKQDYLRELLKKRS